MTDQEARERSLNNLSILFANILEQARRPEVSIESMVIQRPARDTTKLEDISTSQEPGRDVFYTIQLREHR